MTKPFSEACERNKEPILRVLEEAFKDARTVLEIGSGTGQHSVYFAGGLPHLTWQPSDVAGYLPGIRLWTGEAGLPNLLDPIVLDVSVLPWKAGRFEGIFTANTMHIMSEPLIESFFHGLESALEEGGTLCVYGPFNYGGKYTSESNQRFDEFLRSRDPESGIRDYEWVNSLAGSAGLTLVSDHEMPANNRLLVWRKRG